MTTEQREHAVEPTRLKAPKSGPMQVDSIPTSFWRSERLTGIRWFFIYDGPVPERVNDIAPMESWCEYVYMLFGTDDWLLYVGRSFRPADRLAKHLRKPWGHLVKGMAIIRIEEPNKPVRGPGPNTARYEAVAIDELMPIANIAAPARHAMRPRMQAAATSPRRR